MCLKVDYNKMNEEIKCSAIGCQNYFVKGPTVHHQVYCDECRNKRASNTQHRLRHDPMTRKEFLKKRREDRRKRIAADPNFLRRMRISSNKSNRRLKTRVLTHYGKSGMLKCCWRGCNIGDIDCLSLDHIDNNGGSHRRAGQKGGIAIFRFTELNGYPEGYQTLCMNHQMKKELMLRRKNRI